MVQGVLEEEQVVGILDEGGEDALVVKVLLVGAEDLEWGEGEGRVEMGSCHLGVGGGDPTGGGDYQARAAGGGGAGRKKRNMM